MSYLCDTQFNSILGNARTEFAKSDFLFHWPDNVMVWLSEDEFVLCLSWFIWICGDYTINNDQINFSKVLKTLTINLKIQKIMFYSNLFIFHYCIAYLWKIYIRSNTNYSVHLHSQLLNFWFVSLKIFHSQFPVSNL